MRKTCPQRLMCVYAAWENRAALTFQQSGGAVKALSPKARPFCDRQVVPTEGGLRGSLLHAVPVP